MTLVADNHSTDLDAIRGRAGEILALDGWSRERLLDLQRERLRALLAHASAH